MPVYPSFYPHEIQIETIAPQRAAGLLLDGRIQAYVGSEPPLTGARPDSIGSVESLGAFVVVRVNPSSPLGKDSRSACAAAETVVRDIAGRGGSLIFHPYPVTPIHGDYLYHVDLAEAAKTRFLGNRTDSSAPVLRDLKVKADGTIARRLIHPESRVQGSEWDVEVAEVDAAALVASAAYAMNGWRGPPWVRTGWFHAYLLLSGPAGDDSLDRRIQADLERLQSGVDEDPVERINLERSLVTALAAGCHQIVTGYTVRREYFNAEYSAGIENIGYDSLEGLNSPMFIRTVKLKDFPWNGWLRLGIDAMPAAAWNPMGGFNDAFGRLAWSALSDPAFIPSPYESAWVPNRILDVQSTPRR